MNRRLRKGGDFCRFRYCLFFWVFAAVATRFVSWKKNTISDQIFLLEQEPGHRNTDVVDLFYASHHEEIDSHNDTLIPRAFAPWTGALPCFPAESNWTQHSVQRTPTSRGFLFAKLYKCASSTLAGVQIRIAQHEAQRRSLPASMCHARFSHGPQHFPAHTLYSKRNASTSFLWTVLREPTARAVSGFFHFRVSKRKDKMTQFQRSMLRPDPQVKRDYYLQALYLYQKFDRSVHDPHQVAQEILQQYNFIGITERLDESLVVLMLLLQIPMADILYVAAKQSGASYDPYGKRQQCTFLQPSKITSDMQEFLESDVWQNEIKYDVMLYQAANRSLDLTIERLGHDYVQEQLVRFRHAQQVVRERCHPVLPCDEHGRYQHETDCLWKDSACGMQCLDQVATELGLW